MITPREQENVALRAQAWRERADRAARSVEERTGMPVVVMARTGGLWVSLEAVEAWLGTEQPTAPPLLPEADRP